MILANKIAESRKLMGDFKVGLFAVVFLHLCGKDVSGYCVWRRDLRGRAELTQLRSFHPKHSHPKPVLCLCVGDLAYMCMCGG